MELNRVIFPAPTPSYKKETYSNLVWIPRSRYFSLKRFIKPLQAISFNESFFETRSKSAVLQDLDTQARIPCLYTPYSEGSDKILLYFHGNAEDIGYAHDFAKRICQGLKINVLSVEYPGYGIYPGDASAKTIIEDAEIIFDFLTYEMLIESENIYLFGRSIGSGPATYLAANRNPGLLVLMSPYTSIREVVRSLVGSWAQYLVAERFRNIDEISKATCPCFFLHGKKDKLIPDSHSVDLFAKCKGVAGINLSVDMTHNEFSMSNDVIKPLRKFLGQIGHESAPFFYKFPEYALQATEEPRKPNLRQNKRSKTTSRENQENVQPIIIKTENPMFSKSKTVLQ